MNFKGLSIIIDSMKKYDILTFGCQMNLADSELIAGELEIRGYSRVGENETPDVVIINSCAIRDTAEQKIMAKIGSFKKWKKEDKSRILAVGGCMTAQEEVAKKVATTFPYVDIVFGTENLSNFGMLFDTFCQTKLRQIQTKPATKRGTQTSPKRERNINAWVNIMHGCNNFCSYCIVPYVRGRERSRSKDEIVAELKNLVDLGYKQITLLGQNVNSYGNDCPERFGNFSALLRELDQIDGDYRIRFMTSHPKDLSEELIKTIAQSKHICHGLHLPFQSGSTKILASMNRKYTREDYLAKIDMIRSILPDCEITGDCIVGFPGETEEDFCETLSLIEKIEFLSLFMFVYSRRKGTVADTMEQVPDEIKKDRIKRLIAAQNKISTRVAKRMVGKKMRLLIEGTDESGKYYVGMTDAAKAVYVEAEKDILGQFVVATISKSVGSKLFAKI